MSPLPEQRRAAHGCAPRAPFLPSLGRSRRRLLIPLAALALLVAGPARGQDPVAIAPKLQKVLFENDVIRVTRAVYERGEGIGFHEHGRGLVIALTDFKAKSTLPNDSSTTIVKKAGAVWWRERMRHKLRNTGGKRMEFIEIELKDTANHEPTTLSREPARVDPAHFKLEIDNDYVHVLRFRLDSLAASPMHAHLERLSVNLTDLDTRVTPLEGKPGRVAGKAGEITWSPAGVHAVQNLGTKLAERLSIEFKTRAPSASPNVPLKRVMIDKTAICYIEKGAGEPVILLHGELGDLRSWDAQVDALAARYHVVAYSRRFHYPNAWSGGSQENVLRLHIDDLVLLIRKLGLRKVHLVGHGNGGTIALLTALMYPDLVRSAISADGAVPSLVVPTAEGSMIARERRAVIDSSRQLFKRGDARRALNVYLSSEYGGEEMANLPVTIRRLAADNLRALDAQLQSDDRTGMPRCRDLRRLTPPPLLLLEGELSPAYYHRAFDGFMSCAPRTERATIRNTGHGMLHTEPEAFNRKVLEFLSSHR